MRGAERARRVMARVEVSDICMREEQRTGRVERTRVKKYKGRERDRRDGFGEGVAKGGSKSTYKRGREDRNDESLKENMRQRMRWRKGRMERTS